MTGQMGLTVHKYSTWAEAVGLVAIENQAHFDIDVETFSRRERFLIKRLGEYRTIDADIQVQKRLMDGIGLVHEPRITAAAPERDYMRYLCHVGVKLSDGEEQIVEAMKRHINQADFATYEESTNILRLTYATSGRVARQLEQVETDDADEDMLIQLGKAVLAGKQGELYLHLTDTEKVAEKRLQERERAEDEYNLLAERKRIIRETLELMDRYEHEWYLILWHRFVQGEYWIRVCDTVKRDGVGLTRKAYLIARSKALHKFDKWARGLR